jgi:hypothetical protein
MTILRKSVQGDGRIIATMQRSFVLAGAAALAAIAGVVLLLDGTGHEGLHAAIRVTARTSALCVGLAFARIRARELGALLPVSHALHYAFILAAGVTRPPWQFVFGVAVYALMVWNAVRPQSAILYFLWILFLAAMVRPGAIHVAIIALLLLAALVRWWGRDLPSRRLSSS